MVGGRLLCGGKMRARQLSLDTDLRIPKISPSAKFTPSAWGTPPRTPEPRSSISLTLKPRIRRGYTLFVKDAQNLQRISGLSAPGLSKKAEIWSVPLRPSPSLSDLHQPHCTQGVPGVHLDLQKLRGNSNVHTVFPIHEKSSNRVVSWAD